jgi:hypothetical protein
MKASFIAAGLSALLCPFAATADNIPDNYAVSRFVSASPYEDIDGLDIQAVNGTFLLGGSASLLCDPKGGPCHPSDITALYNYTSLVSYDLVTL